MEIIVKLERTGLRASMELYEPNSEVSILIQLKELSQVSLRIVARAQC